MQTISYDEEWGQYKLDIDDKQYKDLPPEAVEIRGSKGKYIVEKLDLEYKLDTTQCTAADLCAWMDNNDIEKSLAYAYKQQTNFDMKKVLIIAAVIIGALLVFYFTQSR